MIIEEEVKGDSQIQMRFPSREKSEKSEIPSFIYTSAHTRDMDTIFQMASQLETIDWNDFDERDPANSHLCGWEDLDEPIDVDIDEGIYVNQPE